MKTKTKPEKVCFACDKVIVRTRTPEGLPRFMWKAETGSYCPKAGGDCRHYPKEDAQ